MRVGASIERRGGEEPVVRRERVGSWESVAMADGDGVLVVVEMEEEDIARVSPARADSDAGHRLVTPPFQGGDQSGPVWSHRSMTNATLE